MTRCEQTDLPADQCAHCLGHTLGDEPTTTRYLPGRLVPLRLRYDGHCTDCHTSLTAGDDAAWDTENRVVVCQGCAA